MEKWAVAQEEEETKMMNTNLAAKYILDSDEYTQLFFCTFYLDRSFPSAIFEVPLHDLCQDFGLRFLVPGLRRTATTSRKSDSNINLEKFRCRKDRITLRRSRLNRRSCARTSRMHPDMRRIMISTPLPCCTRRSGDDQASKMPKLLWQHAPSETVFRAP